MSEVKGQILLVDDNPVNMKLVSYLLTSRGYEVRTAIGAEEARALLATFRPGLILMDLQMPGVDGFTFTRELKADPRTAGIRIIAVTAYAMRGDEDRAREAGCDDYLTKPIDIRTLPDAVARWLGAG